MSCDYKIRVRLDGRNFVVEYDRDGEPLRIKERKNKTHPVLGVYEENYWNAKHHPVGKGDTIVKRIIATAREKYDATP